MNPTAAVAIALTIVLTSCGRGPTTSPAQGNDATPVPRVTETTEPTRVDVVRSGFTIHRDQVGVGAVVRVYGSSARREIDLDIAYYASGRRLGSEEDTLPFCPPQTECFWGQTFVGDTLGSEWRSIDDVRVSIRDGGTADGDVEIEELSLTSDDDSIVVRPVGAEGTVYVVVVEGRTPRFGQSFYTPDGDRREITYPRRSFPPAPVEAFKAFFYPGPVPGSVYGPVD